MKQANFSLYACSLLAMGVLGVILSACQSPEAKKYPYLIKLSLANCLTDKDSPVILNGVEGTSLDTAQLENGQLVLRGTIAHPGVYSVRCFCTAQNAFSHINVYLPADSVQIAFEPGRNLVPAIYQTPGIGSYSIGSYLRNTQLFSTAASQREIASYLRTRDSLWNKYFIDKASAAAKMNAAISTGNKQEIDRWGDSTRLVQESFPDYLAAASEQFIKTHPRSEVGIFALLDAGNTHAAAQRLSPYYRAMPLTWQTSYFGQIVGKRFKATDTAKSAD